MRSLGNSAHGPLVRKPFLLKAAQVNTTKQWELMSHINTPIKQSQMKAKTEQMVVHVWCSHLSDQFKRGTENPE